MAFVISQRVLLDAGLILFAFLLSSRAFCFKRPTVRRRWRLTRVATRNIRIIRFHSIEAKVGRSGARHQKVEAATSEKSLDQQWVDGLSLRAFHGCSALLFECSTTTRSPRSIYHGRLESEAGGYWKFRAPLDWFPLQVTAATATR